MRVFSIVMFIIAGVCRLTIQGAVPSDKGRYTCRAYNEFGQSSTSAELLLARKYKKVIRHYKSNTVCLKKIC